MPRTKPAAAKKLDMNGVSSVKSRPRNSKPSKWNAPKSQGGMENMATATVFIDPVTGFPCKEPAIFPVGMFVHSSLDGQAATVATTEAIQEGYSFSPERSPERARSPDGSNGICRKLNLSCEELNDPSTQIPSKDRPADDEPLDLSIWPSQPSQIQADQAGFEFSSFPEAFKMVYNSVKSLNSLQEFNLDQAESFDQGKEFTHQSSSQAERQQETKLFKEPAKPKQVRRRRGKDTNTKENKAVSKAKKPRKSADQAEKSGLGPQSYEWTQFQKSMENSWADFLKKTNVKVSSSNNQAKVSSSNNQVKASSSNNQAKVSSSNNQAKVSSSNSQVKVSSSTNQISPFELSFRADTAGNIFQENSSLNSDIVSTNGSSSCIVGESSSESSTGEVSSELSELSVTRNIINVCEREVQVWLQAVEGFLSKLHTSASNERYCQLLQLNSSSATEALSPLQNLKKRKREQDYVPEMQWLKYSLDDYKDQVQLMLDDHETVITNLHQKNVQLKEQLQETQLKVKTLLSVMCDSDGHDAKKMKRSAQAWQQGNQTKKPANCVRLPEE